MKQDGFIKLHRSFFDHPFWAKNREYSYAEAFLDLIQRANYAPGKVMIGTSVLNLNAGDQVASLRYLGQRWNWSPAKVMRFFRVLETEHMVKRETKQEQTIVSLCNYSSYNLASFDDETLDETLDETATKQSRNSSETKQKKNKKNKKETNTGEAAELPFNSFQFQQIWMEYVQHRKEKRCSLKPTSTKRALAKLEKMGEQNAILAIEEAIANGWTGIFEPKQQNKQIDGKIKERGLWD